MTLSALPFRVPRAEAISLIPCTRPVALGKTSAPTRRRTQWGLLAAIRQAAPTRLLLQGLTLAMVFLSVKREVTLNRILPSLATTSLPLKMWD